MMKLEQAVVQSNTAAGAGYRRLELYAPAIAEQVRPGQFVHVKVPDLDGSVLRRPFSIFNAQDGILTILFKAVGRGTQRLLTIEAGNQLSILGPLGNTFPAPEPEQTVLLVAGGYGVAPLHFLAKRLCDVRPGIVFIGARTSEDILCAKDMSTLQWDVRIATEDGTLGTRGRVTDILDAWFTQHPTQTATIYACGPDGMLQAVAKRSSRHAAKAWLSLDKHMGCGVGACLACVQKVRKGADIVRVRVCKDGPIFDASVIVWDGDKRDS